MGKGPFLTGRVLYGVLGNFLLMQIRNLGYSYILSSFRISIAQKTKMEAEGWQIVETMIDTEEAALIGQMLTMEEVKIKKEKLRFCLIR